MMYKFPFVVISILGLLHFIVTVVAETQTSIGTEVNPNVTRCSLCELVVASFQRGMERTSREHFSGGNTAWQESHLGSYQTSETRLVEIQERLCQELNKTRGVCLTLAELWEHYLENWWLRDRHTYYPDLHQYLCESMVKACEPRAEPPRRCPPGWTRLDDQGCFDVDECLQSPCGKDEFCTNTEGSYSCSPCDPWCAGCQGPGPDKCKHVKRTLDKKNLHELHDMMHSGTMFKVNTANLLVLVITILLFVIPCVFCVVVPLLHH